MILYSNPLIQRDYWMPNFLIGSLFSLSVITCFLLTCIIIDLLFKPNKTSLYYTIIKETMMELFTNHKPIASMASYKILFLFILLSFLNFATTEAQDQSSTPLYIYHNCSGGNTTANSAFQINVRTLLSSLSSNAPGDNGFYNTTVPPKNPSDSVFGLFMCRGDVPPRLCQQCVQNATQ